MSPNSMNQLTETVFVDAQSSSKSFVSRAHRKLEQKRQQALVMIANTCKEDLPDPPEGFRTPEVADLEVIHAYALALKKANRRMTRRQLRRAIAEKFDIRVITSWSEVLN